MGSAGLSTSPVVSSVGRAHSNSDEGYSKGYMKASPDGTRVACAIVGQQTRFATNNGRVELYDFDNSSGKLSNAMEFNNSNEPAAVNDYDGAYGVEFSPTGRFLYVSHWDNRRSNDQIIQFDLMAGSKSFTDINASGYEVAAQGGNDFGALQLGPDGKIYIAMSNRNRLGVINKPNCKGGSCSYSSNGPSLGSKRSRYGLPTFIQTYFSKKEFEFGDSTGIKSGICDGDSTQFWILDKTNLDSVLWDFGDPGSGLNNISRSTDVTHEYSDTGTFEVKLILYRKGSVSNCLLDTIRRSITIYPVPKVDLGRDTSICNRDFLSLNAFTSGSTYKWSTNSVLPRLTVATKGTYWVDVTLAGCTSRDSIVVDVADYPVLDLKDTLMCTGDSLYIFVNNADTFNWSNSTHDSGIWIKTPGKYWLDAANADCWSNDTIRISESIPPSLTLDKDSTICIGDTIDYQFTLQDASWKFLWNDGDTNFSKKVFQAGNISLTISDSACSTSDTALITLVGPKVVDIGPAGVNICNGDSVRLSATTLGNISYEWHDLSTDSILWANSAGKKKVTIFDGYCYSSDSTDVTVSFPPAVKLGPDRDLCEGDTAILKTTVPPGYKSFWNDAPHSVDTVFRSSGIYILKYMESPGFVCFSSDTIELTFHTIPVLTLGEDTSLCFGDVIDVPVTVDRPVGFSWDDGPTVEVRANNKSIVKHKLTVDDGYCSVSDSMNIDYYPEITVDLGRDTILCDDEELILDIASTSTLAQYEWTDLSESLLSTQAAYTIQSPGGTFIGTVIIDKCSDRDTMSADYDNSPIIEIGRDTILCDNATLDLSTAGSGATRVEWHNGSAAPNFTVNQAGQYWVNGYVGRCTDGDTLTVEYTSTPNIDFGFSDTSFCETQVFDFDFTLPNTTYYWSDGDPSPVKTITESGTYWMVAENICGKDSSGFTFDVDEFGCVILFPNAFSPNGDKLNEVFRPQGNILEFLGMKIYNRWGEKIFEGPADIGWNGTYNGNECQAGIYTWEIQYRKIVDGYARYHTEAGIVHLVR